MTTRVVVAGAVAISGAVVAWRAVDRLTGDHRLPPEHADYHDHDGAEDGFRGEERAGDPNDEPRPSTEIERLLQGVAFVQPTPETATGLAAQARGAARSALDSLLASVRLSAPRREALLDVFQEDLALLLQPSFEEHEALVASRGGVPMSARKDVDEDALEDYRTRYQAYSELYELMALDPSSIDARVRYQGGAQVHKWPQGAHPASTMWAQKWNVYNVPQDPRRARLDVYELRAPIAAPAKRFSKERRETEDEIFHTPALLGFAYASSGPEDPWRPWRLWLYVRPEEWDQNVYFPPFFP